MDVSSDDTIVETATTVKGSGHGMGSGKVRRETPSADDHMVVSIDGGNASVPTTTTCGPIRRGSGSGVGITARLVGSSWSSGVSGHGTGPTRGGTSGGHGGHGGK
ncbi:MAG TPA: hypothetical protein VGU46_00385 [Acidobacteriaceae bacterium]|nr:hypothetical protein [Acidobacteriaceae bacterium]